MSGFDIAEEMLLASVFGNGGPRKYFGGGTDGVFDSAGNVTWNVPVEDESVVVKRFSSFRLRAGHTITVNKRCRGVIIFIDDPGDSFVVEAGAVIDLDKKAGRANPITTRPHIIPLSIKDGLYHPGKSIDPALTTDFWIGLGGRGGRGGRGGSASNSNQVAVLGGAGGAPVIPSWFGGSRGAGGGGGAACSGSYTPSPGGAGGDASTHAADGAGGAARTAGPNAGTYALAAGLPGGTCAGASGSAMFNGDTGTWDGYNYTQHTVSTGAGGVGSGGAGSGGAAAHYYRGNIASQPGATSSNDGGGFLLVICRGNIIMAGTIRCRGGAGANGSAGVAAGTGTGGAAAGGGGGSGGGGGGVVGLLHGGTLTSTGTIDVSGGAGGLGGAGQATGYNSASPGENGENGQAGTIKTMQLAA